MTNSIQFNSILKDILNDKTYGFKYYLRVNFSLNNSLYWLTI